MDKSNISVVGKLITELRQLGISDAYLVVPTAALPAEVLEEYWGSLYQADTLKYRWSDMADPKPSKSVNHVTNTPHCYNVIDIDSGFLVADFSLGPFTGKAAQVHFSMRPGQPTALSLFLAEEVSNTILYQWKDVINLEDSFLDTIFGITPVDNRAACIFIRKAGFKPMGTLASGTKYLNEVTDGLLTQKTRIN